MERKEKRIEGRETRQKGIKQKLKKALSPDHHYNITSESEKITNK